MDTRCFVFVLTIIPVITVCLGTRDEIRKISGVRFLLTVNDTWADPPGTGPWIEDPELREWRDVLPMFCVIMIYADYKTDRTCIATIATDMIRPGNKSQNIMVGDCDNGPLEYRILSPGKNNCKYTVSLIFHSSVIEDASPPTCDLSWNGTYLVPKNPWKPEQDLLPACFTMDSREGYHMTSYWFHILEWFYE